MFGSCGRPLIPDGREQGEGDEGNERGERSGRGARRHSVQLHSLLRYPFMPAGSAFVEVGFNVLVWMANLPTNKTNKVLPLKMRLSQVEQLNK